MSGKKLLLLVDDEAFNLSLLELALGPVEFEFVRAQSGEEALAKVREMERCDAILLDRMMPGIDGVEVLKALKADGQYSGIPIVMQSAAGGSDKIKEAMDAGAFAYVTKPFEDDDLVDTVKKALGGIKEEG